MSNKIITYILAEYPSHTETFILKEMLFIKKSFPLFIIALKRGKAVINKSEYKELEDHLIYITPLILIKSIGFHFLYSFKKKYVLKEWKNIFDNILKMDVINCLRQIKLLLISLCILKLVKQKQVDHIHSHFANYPTDIAMLVSKLSDIPFSFSAHANDIYVNPQKITQKINDAKFVVTCTLYNKKWLDNLVSVSKRDKIHVLYHGVNLGFWQHNIPKNKQKRKQILFIGRLVEKKGVVYLLEAIEKLKNKKQTIHLIIVGKGVDEQKLKKICYSHKLSAHVTFLSWQNPSQIKDLLTISDMLVVPSVIASDGDRDGIPNVILEAMASGLPVICTSVSGITEVIQHGYNGLLVREKDVNQLADSIHKLMNDETLRNSLVDNGLYTVNEKFDSNKSIILLKTLLESELLS